MPILEHIPLGSSDQFIQNIAKKIINQGDSVIDIGMNYMQNTRFFLKCVGRPGQVIGIEPNSVLYEKIKKYVIPNGPTFRIYNKLLAEQKRLVVFRQFDDPYSGLSGILDSIPPRTSKTTIDSKLLYRDLEFVTSTLDNIVNPDMIVGRLALIKIDCEGADCKIIQGGIELIKKFRPPIIIELSPDTRKILPDLADKLNYDFYSLESEKKISPTDIQNDFSDSNVLLLHNEDQHSLEKLGKQ